MWFMHQFTSAWKVLLNMLFSRVLACYTEPVLFQIKRMHMMLQKMQSQMYNSYAR